MRLLRIYLIKYFLGGIEHNPNIIKRRVKNSPLKLDFYAMLRYLLDLVVANKELANR